MASRVALAALIAGSVACNEQKGPPPIRQWTDDLKLQISADPAPPRARERILFKVVVQDKESGQPIDHGEGVIYASNRDGKSIWDSLQPGPEVGTYYSTLNFITAGQWAIAIQFRRDSTKRLQKTEWMQEVFAARGEPGS